MAFMLNKLLISYMALILIYGMTCLYSLFWVFRRPLKEYSFEKVREESSFSDIPDVKNDFAFLLHMVDQYDQLYSKRFGVFLSEVSENKLREISLNHEWTFEKLRQLVTRNAQDQQELHLFMLSGLPNAVFDLTDLEILKLELIPDARFTAKVSQMTSLLELHLCHCPAKVEQTGFAFLRDHLRCLHVKFTDVAEIPAWVYLLRSLRELNLVGNLNSENNKMIGLESMRDLRHLKTLCLKSNLTKMPTNITELSPHLIKLVVHNDGTKLMVLNSLKKMTSLIELELHNCELERIPHAIFSLTNLQELDLKSNNIRTIEEIISFQHLKRLTCLKLWHNKISNIPSSIGQVKSLEALHLNHNKLETLPPALFTLPKLRHLDLGHNSITVLPPDIGLLHNLQYLAINMNKLEVLPKQLFRCTKLKVLCLAHNALTTLPETMGQLVQLTQLELRGNCLDRLPATLGNCRLLRKSALVVEDHLFDTLPLERRKSVIDPWSELTAAYGVSTSRDLNKVIYVEQWRAFALSMNKENRMCFCEVFSQVQSPFPKAAGPAPFPSVLMFALTEVASLNDIQPTYRILKPWWDVFMDYLGVVMLMLTIFTMTMQISKDQVACLPYLEDSPGNIPSRHRPLAMHVSMETKDLPDSAVHEIHNTHVEARQYTAQPQPTGIKTNLDFQQYVFINQVCYHVALPWYSKYFPFLMLIHTIILMVSSNFWFKYPKTSSKIENFVSILGRCFESPWTTKALSETACEDSEENKQRLTSATSGPRQVSQEENDDSANPRPSTPTLVKFSLDKPITEVPSTMTILDKNDGEQAKALFEKVRQFKAHVEDSDFIYKLYLAQTIVKTAHFILVLSYTSTFLAKINFNYECKPDYQHLTGYATFFCTHNMAFMLNKLLISYMALILIYGMTCLYSLFWVFRRPLKEYSFEKVREESSFSDIPDVKSDFAFLLHMVDQYDQLYSKRFGVFLSEVSENKLREISLNLEWTFEKLRQRVTRNAQDQQELHLSMLSGLPNAVFDLTDLEILKLELIPDARFTAKVSQMTSLLELHLCHCPAKVEQTGFAFLRDHLRCLHVKFTDVAEIPAWVYLLRSLRELNLVGNLNSENNKMIGLESMRELRHLKTLCLKSNLTKMPTNITELSPHLIKLVVHNDGTKLMVLNSLKKMTCLIELELHNCELERIPDAIFSLTNLQELDLKSNNIETIEEITSFQHLKRLTCLKLWHNKISNIPSSIGQVKSLEALHLNHNKLETVPPALFTLPKLRHLDLGHNSITVLHPDIGLLRNLQYLAINMNKLEVLPKQLFRCTKLKVLCLSHNALTTLPETIGQLLQLTQLELRGNCLDRLPATLGNCRLLRKSALVVEDHLFDTLPLEVKQSISRETNVFFSSGL
ncbi:hypothetical protein WMY93_001063 [Mugilogobius chulae]|uniref:LRRC8 pannexin-like TM region domain-containing protein n=1 Tax=Mugilogobius chulae TaxID=88201 RepID=A0AAW0QB40_9GOBI